MIIRSWTTGSCWTGLGAVEVKVLEVYHNHYWWWLLVNRWNQKDLMLAWWSRWWFAGGGGGGHIYSRLGRCISMDPFHQMDPSSGGCMDQET